MIPVLVFQDFFVFQLHYVYCIMFTSRKLRVIDSLYFIAYLHTTCKSSIFYYTLKASFKI